VWEKKRKPEIAITQNQCERRSYWMKAGKKVERELGHRNKDNKAIERKIIHESSKARYRVREGREIRRINKTGNIAHTKRKKKSLTAEPGRNQKVI